MKRITEIHVAVLLAVFAVGLVMGAALVGAPEYKRGLRDGRKVSADETKGCNTMTGRFSDWFHRFNGGE